MIINKDAIDVGDILFLSDAIVEGKSIGSRPFLVWGFNKLSPISQIILLEISGKPKIGVDFPYNVDLKKTTQNGLNIDSHIKTDQMFIYCENIIPVMVIKMGKIDISTWCCITVVIEH